MFAHSQTPIFQFAPGTGGTVNDIVIGGTTYRVHRFTSSGTFSTTSTNIPLTVLLVGGGGGGANGSGIFDGAQFCGGGGGAGGYVAIDVNVPASTNYNILIGQGGAGGTNGSATTAFGYTALGGGRGAQRSSNTQSGQGGSGGGGWSASGGGSSGNTSVQFSTYGYGQGNSGASGSEATLGVFQGGGGGGAGAPGVFASSVGGAGVVNNITGANVTYAPGGGGGLAQPRNSYYNGANTLPNFGAGGGGGTSATFGRFGNNRDTGLAGTSGVVIIRYPITTV